MRILILKDQLIDAKELDSVLEKYAAMFLKNVGIKPEFYIEEKAFAGYPTYTDSDGDKRPTGTWLRLVADEVKKRYRSYGIDHLVLFVHEDNWQSDPPGKGGIWGTNYSNIYHGYQLHYCRYDRDNQANSLGTLHHEIHHSFDALIKVYTGVNANTLFKVNNFDQAVTHGKSQKWNYIRYMENQESLQILAPYLRDSYRQRKETHTKEVSQLETVVSLLQKVVFLLKQKFNQKDGVTKKYDPNNK